MDELTNVEWIKSSYSGNNGGDCVEIGSLAGGVGVRDSKRPHGPTLRIADDEWRAFRDGLKRGGLDGSTA
ncbi:hypothetical protein Sru01_58830 [Sphaerisporangium rufum]|uniref:DUF397 domain-containing protein n=1 Tax=Sphaerisporangium rufum TaxID=1381558 RepID=A0A919R740_9ACTN|nr:DUF397 domain-containing protein [Sphaerisporangium rufum]GII80901.1 hypothetical protein Sru01_58830 [Sphaerisporangium rufum]